MIFASLARELLIAISFISREELVRVCLQRGTQLVQAIANSLFNLPSKEDPDGPLVNLPPPTTKLPREKPVSFYCLSFINSYNSHIFLGDARFISWLSCLPFAIE